LLLFVALSGILLPTHQQMEQMNLLEEAKKQPKKVSLSEYKEAIGVLRDKGYTWRDIANFLNDRGVETDHTKIYKMMQRSKKMNESRVYDKLITIVENNSGEMTKEIRGVKGVIWHITLNGKHKSYDSHGEGHIPELDSLYVPRVVNPKTWDDYKDELLEDSEKILLSRFGL
jgi:hypothetical protein